AKGIERRPQLVGVSELFDPDGRGAEPRLEYPGRPDARDEFAQPVVVDDFDEFRDQHALFLRLNAHRQLVAEMARRGFTDARNPQVFAQRRRRLDVEFIERHDAVNLPRPGEVADGVNDVGFLRRVGHHKDFVNTLARPAGLGQLFRRQQQHGAALPLALAHELLTFFVTRQTENRQGRWLSGFRHTLGLLET